MQADKSTLTPRYLLIQYLIGLSVNAILTFCVITSDISYNNIERSTIPMPRSERWFSVDTIGYVNIAKNFFNHDFGAQGKYRGTQRTIGYPCFLATTMSHENWIVWVLIFQTVVAAMLYPATAVIASTLFSQRYPCHWVLFGFCLCSSAYFARSCYILTDLFFSSFFVSGMALLFSSIANRSWLYAFSGILLIGIAAQIRPTLFLFPILNLLFLLLILKQSNRNMKDLKLIAMIAVTTVTLLVACNIPSYRNYKNRGAAVPSTVMSTNMFDIGARSILEKVDRLDHYYELEKNVKQEKNLSKMIKLKNRYALEVFREYPRKFLRNTFGNAGKMMGGTHWLAIYQYWGHDCWYFNINGRGKTNNMKTLLVMCILWGLIYLVMYTAFAFFLISLLKQKQYLFFIALTGLICYFIAPAFIAGGNCRLRLPVEGIIILCAIYQIVKTAKVYAIGDESITIINKP